MSNTFVIEQLNALLERFRAMPTMPLAGSPEAMADHEGWMKAHEAVDRLEVETTTTALLALPPDIAELYEAVENERCRILSIGPYYQPRPYDKESEQQQSCSTAS